MNYTHVYKSKLSNISEIIICVLSDHRMKDLDTVEKGFDVQLEIKLYLVSFLYFLKNYVK